MWNIFTSTNRLQSLSQCFFFPAWKIGFLTWKFWSFHPWKCRPLREKTLQSAREKPIPPVKISSKFFAWNLGECTWKFFKITCVKTRNVYVKIIIKFFLFFTSITYFRLFADNYQHCLNLNFYNSWPLEHRFILPE